MMKNCFALLILAIPSLLFAQIEENRSLADKVNPLMGTMSTFNLSAGNTYPAIALPWGMNFWVPQTGKMGDGWVYTYTANKIRGFKQTHQPSPWINDYGQFSIMPETGKPVVNEEKRASWFSHKAEVARPYYYSVYLADYDITAELVPSERAAMFRFTYPHTDSCFLVVDAFDNGSFIQVFPKERKVIGYTTKNSGGVPDNFKNYFVLKFDTDILSFILYDGDKEIKDGSELKGNHAMAVLQFKNNNKTAVHCRVASSFISSDQAEVNLKEVENRTFEEMKQNASEIWNKELDCILVEGGSNEQQETFYSCLYRTMLFPRKFYEIDSNGNTVHYSPYNGKVLPGYMFTDNGFWDTFRAAFPLINILKPSLNVQIQEGLVNVYKEGGWLPEWASPGHRDCMIGSNSASIIADAYLKGLRGYDIQLLYEAMLKNADNEGPVTSVGRYGVKWYNQLGYVPYDVKINENTARTLEYAYADFTLWQLARELKRPQAEIDRFAKQCQNYRNVFDPTTRLMRGRNKDGNFQEPFSPFKWGDAFTEGNSWHYTWSVFHDVKGLIDLMGGEKMFTGMLDSVFKLPPVFDDSYYGFPIHEIREMQIMNMGNYAHGNQPIQHMPYLYNYAGESWKSQFWVREIMNRLYKPTPDGYCGDEDNGQTSAWFVFSAMGFYPVCPGTSQYILGAPLFNRITLSFENGKKTIIQAPANSSRNRYIKSVKINDRSFTPVWINHSSLMEGMDMKVEMTDKPDKERKYSKDDMPYSFSGE